MTDPVGHELELTSAVPEIDQAQTPSQRTRRPAFSVATLGFLSLVPVAAVLLAQAFQVGYFTALGSQIPVSDSNLWASCASALANGDSSYNLAFCLRRPLTIIAQAPLFALAPQSMASIVVLHVLMVCLTLWWFLISVSRTLQLNRLGTLAVWLLALWPVFVYGTYMGPEAPALALSFVSAAAIPRFLKTRRPLWGLLAAGTAILAFQIRPGNFLLTGVLAIGAMLLSRASMRRWLTVAGMAVVLIALYVLPIRLLMLAGWTEAGHAANFWTTAYSAATPAVDTWMDANDRFAPEVGCPPVAEWTPDPCLAFDSEEFGQVVRDEALRLIRENPRPLVGQMFVNLRTLAGEGFINPMWANPFTPAWRVWQPEELPRLSQGWDGVGTAGATLLWAGSWALLALTALGLFRLHRRRRSRPAGGEPVDTADSTIWYILWMGALMIGGAALSYALVGHDEPQRHLVQNIPYLLLLIGAIFHLFWTPKEPRAGAAAGLSQRRWPAALVVALVAGVLVGSLVEGRNAQQSLEVVRPCGSTADPQGYQVVSAVSIESTEHLPVPASWREFDQASSKVVFADRSWLQQMMNRLPPGHVLDLRAVESGEIVPVFLSDDEYRAVGGQLHTATWCTRTPSAYGVMVVHDLVAQ